MASLTWIAIVSGGSVCAIASRGSRFNPTQATEPPSWCTMCFEENTCTCGNGLRVEFSYLLHQTMICQDRLETKRKRKLQNKNTPPALFAEKKPPPPQLPSARAPQTRALLSLPVPLQENAALFEFPLCLSRACLGKMINLRTYRLASQKERRGFSSLTSLCGAPRLVRFVPFLNEGLALHCDNPV
eukprot:COSAG06_NODE_432_length_15846_cov_18.957325_2_plen_186_part_00